MDLWSEIWRPYITPLELAHETELLKNDYMYQHVRKQQLS